VLSRPLSEAEPQLVVVWKVGIGAALARLVAFIAGEPGVTVTDVGILMGVGAIGYGCSLAFYLKPQRHLGARRTGSVFALGPFIGALVAIALGDRHLGWSTAITARLFAIRVWLHLSETHGHTQ